jgi:hypothetical protein
VIKFCFCVSHAWALVVRGRLEVLLKEVFALLCVVSLDRERWALKRGRRGEERKQVAFLQVREERGESLSKRAGHLSFNTTPHLT